MGIFIIILLIIAVLFLGPSGGGGRSDYYSGTKGALVPEPLDRTRLRKRRRQRRTWAAMDAAEK